MTGRTHVRVPILGRVLTRSGSDFVSIEALGGVALLGATVAALVWANVAAVGYADVWGTELTIGFGRFAISEDLLHWVNDGLMTVFFFVVGLEIKRELVRGELRDPRTASLPVLAAVGGMAVPALLYAVVNAGSPGSRGWAIPMATDIAFAVVVLAILGTRVPKPLKLFLLTLAIVDDIGAIVIIALFYSEGIAFGWLAGAVCVIAAMLVMQRAKVARPVFYIVPGVVLWVCTLESGVHATIAGVVLGLLTPARPFGGRDVIEHLERKMHPWSSFLVIPIFALANAGVNLDLATIEHAAMSEIAWGIVVGLVVGKPLGIMAATGIGLLLRLGRLPRGVSLRQVFGVACIAGIGFTVSLFIADLSFAGTRLSEAKTGILAASLLSATFGIGWLLCIPGTRPSRRREDEATDDRSATRPDSVPRSASSDRGASTPTQIYAAMVDIVVSERRFVR
jgi:Na+:H+ antiporter, NhaA family